MGARQELIEEYVRTHMAVAEKTFRAEAEDRFRECPVCSSGFERTRSDRRFCCKACRNLHWQRKYRRKVR